MDISLQLYSIKEEAAERFEQALELTEKAGYQGVEFAGYFGKTSEQMKALLNQHHLKPVSTHVGLQRLQEGLDEELEYAKQLGYNLIICPYSSCETKGQTLEDAKFLETCAQKAAKKGIIIGYHNHAHEFKQFDGKYALDILLEAAPTVKFEPDLYWIALGEADPVQYIAPLAKAGRICAIHAKELAKTGRDNVYIGQGKIDFLAIAKMCPPSVYPWILEQEEFTSDHYDGIAQSRQGLQRIFERL
ncbi:MAG: sugar phosphate isomerase/epimerase [Treponema sp.]|jgi:sugar phosphate isomerase/epimerase|nr:sugar phosphate isomerase/epimerase [Treponema sp.]